MTTKTFWRRIRPTTIGLMLFGLALCLAGFSGNYGLRPADDEATWWGILAGIGFAVTFIGVIKIWMDLTIAAMAEDPGGAVKRERLQAQRAWLLWVYPLATVVLLVMAIRPLEAHLAGRGDLGDLWGICLPVLYAWIVPMFTLGWDGHSRQNRRFLDDELTQALRARALKAAFVVLMTGVTLAFVVGLARPDLGMAGMMIALAAGGATIGIRFTWLYGEAGRDA